MTQTLPPFALFFPAGLTRAQLSATSITNYLRALPAGNTYTNADVENWIKTVVQRNNGWEAFISVITGQDTDSLVTADGSIVRQYPEERGGTTPQATPPPASAGVPGTPSPAPASVTGVGPIDALISFLSQLLQPAQQIASAASGISGAAASVSGSVAAAVNTIKNAGTNAGAFALWLTDLHTLERIAAIAIGLLLVGTGLTAFLSSFVNWSDVADTAKSAATLAAL